MGKGFWYGDKDGGHTYQGDITDVTLDDKKGELSFRYTYTTGMTGGGRFKGTLRGDRLGGAWDEDKDRRHGLTDMNREEPKEGLSNRFRGRYWLESSSAPKEPDDDGFWVIEFDL